MSEQPDRDVGEPRAAEDAVCVIERAVTVMLRRTLEQVWSEGYGSGGAVDRYTYPLLVVIELHGAQRLAQLAERLGVSKPTVSRQVTRLVAAGLLEVLDDPIDSRSGLVELSPAGMREVLAVRDRRLAPLRGVIEHWPVDDRQRFADLLLRFNSDLDAGP